MLYRVLKGFSLSVLVVYFFVGVYANYVIEHASGDTSQIYPFASWGLFQRVPNTRSKFTFRILKAGEQILSPPVYFSEAQAYYTKRGNWPSNDEGRVRLLAEAIQNADAIQVKKFRTELEKNFIINPTVYEIVFFSINPLEFIHNGSVRELVVYAQFTSGKDL